MPVQTHVVRAVFLVLCLSMLTLQSGCSNSGSGQAEAPGSNANAVQLALSTTSGGPAVVADGHSTIPLRAQVTNGAGIGMAGVPVTFATPAGGLSESPVVRVSRDSSGDVLSRVTRVGGSGSVTVTTDANGVAQVLLTAGTTTGTAVVTADALGFRTHIDIFFVPGPAARVQLDASPNTVTASSTSALTATVTDANGNPVPGETVTFTLSTNTSGASLSAASGTTDGNGQATMQYTAGTTAGADTVWALATSTSVAGSTSVTVTPPPPGTGAPVPSRIDLLVSSPQLDSDGSDTVTLTALVRDATNNIVSGAAVNFTADSGLIQVVRGTTDTTGTAMAFLTIGGDPTNRTITLTATTGTLTPARNTVQVTGTTLTLSGATSAVLHSVIPLSILLRDSAGMGIPNGRVTVTTDFTGAVPVTVPTDFTGAATVNITANEASTHTIRAEALGAAAMATLNVSGDNFVLKVLDPSSNNIPVTTLDLGKSYTVSVEWERNGMHIPDGRTVNFFTTRGTLSTLSATTVNGIATVAVSSAQAGSAVINAVGIDPTESPSNQLNIEFRATMPSAMLLQAMPTSLGVNATGSTAQQSVITAIVQDANGNLVADREVSFLLTDTTGGTIFPASAITDNFGRASTVYTAGTVPSAQDGVIIQATVTGTTVSKQVRLTVAGQALFVILGTGNLLQALSSTQYAKPYSVLVTDANGNPVTNATIELSVLPTNYQKGIYVPVFNDTTCSGWAKGPSTITCPNEDLNLNGILDQDEDFNCNGILDPGEDSNLNGVLDRGEDFNGNCRLDPGNVATTVPGSVITDASGFAFFTVVYAKEFTWVEVALQARATVAGSEGSSRVVFFLPGLLSDFSDCNVSPPGVVSPYGMAAICTVPD